MTTLPPFLALSLPIGYGVTPVDLVGLIRSADEAGLSGVAVGELTSTDAVALIAAAAPVTARLRLESSVLSVLTRSPAMFAMSAATLANLSNNRFVLGLGAGSPLGAGYHGLEFSEPLARVERWVRDIRAALDGGTLTDWGSFRLRGLDPVRVPILVAAMNQRMLELAGRMGDGVILNFAGPEQVSRLSRIALAARASAGVDSSFEVHATLWADATGDPDCARDRFRSEMAPYLAVPTYRSAVVALSDSDAIDRAADAWHRNGRKAAAGFFPESIVDAMVATDKSEVVAKVSALLDAGCTGVRLTPLTYESGTARYAEAVVGLLTDAEQELQTLRAG